MSSERADLSLVLDIRQSIDLIRQYISGLDRDSFEHDWLRRDATAFRLLVIGEAVRHLSPELISRLPDVDWRGMIGLRHRLAHDYGSTNFSVLWTIVNEDVPALGSALASL